MPPLLFLHANGFPAGVYRQFLDALKAKGPVEAPDIIDTPVSLRPGNRWPKMAEIVLSRVRQFAAIEPRPVLVGHSMGGYLSLIAADRAGDAVSGVVLIDSPLVLGWRGPFLESMRVTGLARYGGPAPVAARRRYRWNSAGEAREHFSSKAFCRNWADGVLDDYIEHALVPEASTEVSLRISREVERDIYANLPGRHAYVAYKRLISRGVPVYMVAGRHSREMQMAGAQRNRQLFQDYWVELPGGHLIPLEHPEQCASAVEQCATEIARLRRGRESEPIH